jgi:hypothetical protein
MASNATNATVGPPSNAAWSVAHNARLPNWVPDEPARLSVPSPPPPPEAAEPWWDWSSRSGIFEFIRNSVTDVRISAFRWDH